MITGAGGFIGYHLSKDLVARGYNVIGVDLHYHPETEKSRYNGFRPEVCDFRDWERMKELLSGVNAVFHLASAHLQISLPKSEYWDINVNSLRPLMKLAHEKGVQRFVHVSSVGVYGDLQTLPADEETQCKPQSIYGETKLEGEAEVAKFSEETGLATVILRPAWVYGPRCPRTLKIYKFLRKGRFAMIGNGKNLRHPLYIADMLSASRLAMASDSAVGETFIIGGDSPITTKELIKGFCKVFEIPEPKIRIPLVLGIAIASITEMLFWLTRKEPPISRRTLEFFNTQNAYDISKAKERLGYSPKFSFEDGLKNSRSWCIQNV